MRRPERAVLGKTTPFSVRANGDVGTRASLFPGLQTNYPACTHSEDHPMTEWHKSGRKQCARSFEGATRVLGLR